jgi:hypothetical protein
LSAVPWFSYRGLIVSNQAKQTVRAASTFGFLGAAVVAGAYLCSWSGVFAASVPLQPSDDPLANRLQIVEPRALDLGNAGQPVAKGDEAVMLQNWVYTNGNPSQGR